MAKMEKFLFRVSCILVSKGTKASHMNSLELHVKRILKILIYIEQNIDEELSMEQLAKLAHYSIFHFHRIFQAITKESLHQYIKRLRVEKAAGKLRYTNQSITDIALDTNYETPSAFTKAFKQSMGTSPKKYRDIQSAVRIIARKINQGLPMIYPDTIEKNVPDLHLTFIRRLGNYMQSPWEAWQAMGQYMEENKWDRSKVRHFGICHDDPNITPEEKLRYDAAILPPSPGTGKGEVGHQTLQGGKFAIFSHTGSYAGLEQTFDQIFLKWLPQSSEAFDESRTIFCEYFHMEYAQSQPEKLKTHLFIPLL